jgi:hypothetical protein
MLRSHNYFFWLWLWIQLLHEHKLYLPEQIFVFTFYKVQKLKVRELPILELFRKRDFFKISSSLKNKDPEP